MSRANVLQIQVSGVERSYVESQADAEGSSLSSWLRRRLFFGFVEVRAFSCASLKSAYEEAARLDRELTPVDSWPWVLRLRRLLEGSKSSVFNSDLSRWYGGVTEQTRFVLAGSPWPYKIVEDYSKDGRAIFRLENERAENLFETSQLRSC